MSFLQFIIDNLPTKSSNKIYAFAFHDILRLIILQTTTHFLFHLTHNNIPLVSRIMFETLMFMIAGICVYWFLFYTIFPIIKNSLIENLESNSQETEKEKMEDSVSLTTERLKTRKGILKIDTNETNRNKETPLISPNTETTQESPTSNQGKAPTLYSLEPLNEDDENKSESNDNDAI